MNPETNSIAFKLAIHGLLPTDYTRPYYGPSGGDLAFMFIRERRKNGESFRDALENVRRQYPQLFPGGQ